MSFWGLHHEIIYSEHFACCGDDSGRKLGHLLWVQTGETRRDRVSHDDDHEGIEMMSAARHVQKRERVVAAHGDDVSGLHMTRDGMRRGVGVAEDARHRDDALVIERQQLKLRAFHSFTCPL